MKEMLVEVVEEIAAQSWRRTFGALSGRARFRGIACSSRTESTCFYAECGGSFLLEQFHRDTAKDGEVMRAMVTTNATGVLI